MITLSAISAKDGQTVEERQITLPPLALSMGGPCAASSIRRQQFNTDFSQFATLVVGRNNTGRRAVAIATSSGAVLGPTADSSGFTSSPDHRSPAFHPQTGDLWYIDNSTDQILSRRADDSDKKAVDRGDAGDTMIAFSGNTMWLVRGIGGPDSLAANPSGTYAALNDLNGMKLWRHGTPEGRAGHFPGQTTSAALSGKDVPAPGPDSNGCVPQFWTDDHTVVCIAFNLINRGRRGSNLFRVKLSDSFQSVVDVRPLLPITDRKNSSPVLSPDRTAIAFVSTQGDDRAIFRQNLTPGAEPIKIIDLSDEHLIMAWL